MFTNTGDYYGYSTATNSGQWDNPMPDWEKVYADLLKARKESPRLSDEPQED